MSRSIAERLADVPLRNVKADVKEGEGPRRNLTCEVCEQPLRRGRRFCSFSCRSKWQHADRRRRGVHGVAWKGGISSEYGRYSAKYRQLRPEQIHAQRLVQRCVRNGSVVRPADCSTCGCPCKPQAHHDDYSKPFDVRWLCQR